MWYWTLPSLALTGACFLIPHYLHAASNYASVGHLHRRNYETDYRDYYLYVRDRRVSGSEYDPRGLESLDKPLDLASLQGYIYNQRLAVPWKE